MDNHQPDSDAHQVIPLNKEQYLIVCETRSRGECMKQGKNLRPVFQVATGQLTDDKGMNNHLKIEEQFFQMRVAFAEVVNPDGSINQDHYDDPVCRRLGIGWRFFSVPPNLASRLLLSMAMMASSPCCTKAVFSLMPVNWLAFFKVSSSILSVVLMMYQYA